jgi:hypothetical protein
MPIMTSLVMMHTHPRHVPHVAKPHLPVNDHRQPPRSHQNDKLDRLVTLVQLLVADQISMERHLWMSQRHLLAEDDKLDRLVTLVQLLVADQISVERHL